MKILAKSIYLILIGLIFFSCAGNKASTQIKTSLSLLSEEIKSELREANKSIVAINSIVKYEIQTFNYLQVNGQFVPDASSPLKYKLVSYDGNAGIMVEKEDKTLSGGGLIIYINHETARIAILTSNHLVDPQDTTNVYYLDEDGIPTDVLFARYIVKDVVTTVRMGGNWRVEAKIITTDPINDLALITLQTQNSLWREFPNQIGYDLDLSWGDWVFLFGFPKGIKQMTGGWVSKAPYRNTLAVDAVVRFGYSGGPVFTISRDKVKLTFVGLIKSVPRSTMDYIAPDVSLPMGYRLTFEDMDKLFVKKEVMVDYGTAYFVAPKAIKDFLNRNVTVIESAGIHLHSKYYGN